MEEHKRRRRAQQACPEQQEHPEQQAADTAVAQAGQSALHRRRRAPQIQPEHQEYSAPQIQPAQPSRHEVKNEKKASVRRKADRVSIGAAVLLGMAGKALSMAAGKIKQAWIRPESRKAGSARQPGTMRSHPIEITDQGLAEEIGNPKNKPFDHEARARAAGEGHAAAQERMRRLAMALCVCVALFSAWQVGGIVLRSVKTKRLNESLSQQRAAMIEAQQEMDDEPDGGMADGEPEAAVFEPEMLPQAEPAEDAGEEPAQDAPMSITESEAPKGEESMPQGEVQATAAPDIVKTTKYRRLGGDALPEMAQLHQQNHDLVAWLQIPDVLDLPVVYKDNSYYLTRDFNQKKNASGTIFLDENHPFKEKTQNLLLHGHNMKDGTMFGRLAQYLYDDTYLRNHPFIYFDTLWQKEQYVIFAVLDVSLTPSDPRFFNYFTHDTFSSDAEFSMYIRQLQLRSRYAIPIDVEPSDALLTLSTCLDDDRLVIVCRRLRENETRSELRAMIRMATKQ